MSSKYIVEATVTIMKDDCCELVIISNLSNLDRLYFYLDQLLLGQISLLHIANIKPNNFCVSIATESRHCYDSEKNIIFLTYNNVSVLKKLISDVLLDKAFVGYHYDLSLSSKNNKQVEICFELS